MIVGIILQEVCGSEWVQESVEVERCWEEKQWYNPWDWFTTIVCVTAEVLKWVLKWICKIYPILIIVLVIVCIVVVLVAILA